MKRRSLGRILSTIFCIWIILFTLNKCAVAQSINVAKYNDNKVINVFVTQFTSQADVIVYIERFFSQRGTDGTRWYFSFPNVSQPNISIRYTKYYSQADLVVKFTEYRSRARWRRPEKKHLLEGK